MLLMTTWPMKKTIACKPSSDVAGMPSPPPRLHFHSRRRREVGDDYRCGNCGDDSLRRPGCAGQKRDGRAQLDQHFENEVDAQALEVAHALQQSTPNSKRNVKAVPTASSVTSQRSGRFR